MSLDLVHRRRDRCGLEQLLRLLDGEVADANAADLAGPDLLLQCGPGVGDGDVRETVTLRHWVYWEQRLAAVLEGDGPVDLYRLCQKGAFTECD